MTPNPNPSPELREAMARQIDPVAFDEDGFATYRQARRDAAFRAADRVDALSQTLPAPGEVEAGRVVLEGRGDGTYAEAERAICGLIALVTQRKADGDRIAVAKALASHPDSSWDDYEWEDMASYVRDRFLEQADLAIATLATVAAANDEAFTRGVEAAAKIADDYALGAYEGVEPLVEATAETIAAAIRLSPQGGGK